MAEEFPEFLKVGLTKISDDIEGAVNWYWKSTIFYERLSLVTQILSAALGVVVTVMAAAPDSIRSHPFPFGITWQWLIVTLTACLTGIGSTLSRTSHLAQKREQGRVAICQLQQEARNASNNELTTQEQARKFVNSAPKRFAEIENQFGDSRGNPK